jgi:WD40 repeat protein
MNKRQWLLGFMIALLLAGCGSLPHAYNTQASETVPPTAQVTPSSTNPPTQEPTSRTAAQTIQNINVLDEIPGLSFDEYNSIIAGQLTLPSQKVTISPDGKILAALANVNSYRRNIESSIFLWNTDKVDNSVKSFKTTIKYLEGVAFSHDGKFIAAWGCETEECHNTKIVIFDWVTGIVQHTISVENSRIEQIEFSPDDKSLIAQDIANKLSIRSLSTGKIVEIQLNGTSAGAHGFALEPKGEFIVIGDWDGINFLDAKTLTVLRSNTVPGADIGYGRVVSISADGNWLLASGCSEYDFETCVMRQIFIWSSESSDVKRTLSLGNMAINALAFSPTNKLFASGTSSHGLEFWNVDTGGRIKSPYITQSSSIDDIVFFPVGNKFATLTDKGIILGEISPDQSSWCYTTLNRFGIARKFFITPAGNNLNVHAKPSLKSRVLKSLKAGTEIEIIFGPEIAEGYVWWGISIGEEYPGWVVENPDWYKFIP